MTERELRFLRNLADTLRSIQQDIRAIRDQQERVNERNEQPPPTPPPILSAELQIPERIERSNHANSDREYTTQKWLTVGTWLAFAAAAIYAGIAYSQKKTMDDTYKEIVKQTAVQRQEAVGNTAALITADFGPSRDGISVYFDNRGVVDGRNVTATFKAQRMTLPGLARLGPVIEKEYTEPVVPNGNKDGRRVYGIDFQMPDYTVAALQEMRETIKIEGTFSFDNGYGDIIPKKLCLYWLTSAQGTPGGEFLPCDGFETRIANIFKQKNAAKDKTQ
ncbi:MAG TPA: hypothetical protein VIY49_02600 [Bryobacteraceae bacterium]